MPSGTVKWYNEQKGYGFIADDAGGPDIFVHATAVKDAGLDRLDPYQKITYQTKTAGNGRIQATALAVPPG
jgi:CspA family cold shock protein